MSFVEQWGPIIAACAGIGAFIDFSLGKIGQAKVKNWLEAWWISLEDAKITNFGKKEAEMATALFEAAFGKFLSFRRLAFLLGVCIFGLALWLIAAAIWPYTGETIGQGPVTFSNGAPVLATRLFVLTCALTLMQMLASAVAKAMPVGAAGNLLAYVGLLISQYFVLALFTHVIFAVIDYRPDPYPELWVGDPPTFWSSLAAHIDWDLGRTLFDFSLAEKTELSSNGAFLFVMFSIEYTPLVLRLAWTAMFLLSFLVPPIFWLTRKTILRLVESDKPIFTITFAGIGALTKAITEISKALH